MERQDPMKHNRTRFRSLLATTIGLAMAGVSLLLSGCSSPSSESYSHSAGVEVHSVDDFYEPLSPYGDWVEIGSYGRCWRPYHVDSSWRPYSDGSWVHCDAGWYWQSEEPWGWATYHYGAWDYDSGFGWYWVPQTRWAPSWVAWRSGGGYVGWAPLRPSTRIEVGVTIHDHDVRERDYVFVPERRFVQRVRPRTVIVNNPTIVHQTVNITKINVRNNTTVINEGPRVAEVEKASGSRVRTVQAARLRSEQEGRVTRQDRAVARARSDTTTTARPATNTQTRSTGNAPRPSQATNDRDSQRERERTERTRQTTRPPSPTENKSAPSPTAPTPRAAERDDAPRKAPPTATDPARSKPPKKNETAEGRPPQDAPRPKAKPAEQDRVKRPAGPSDRRPNSNRKHKGPRPQDKQDGEGEERAPNEGSL
jgi:hypothetical protein